MLPISYSENSPKFEKDLKKLLKDFEKHRAKLLKFPFTKLPWQHFGALKNLKIKFKKIVVVGIGGSSLGAKSISKALNSKSITFLDNVDPDFVTAKLKSITLKKTFFILISKSGETAEVISLASILFNQVACAANFIAITDNPAGELAKFAHENKIFVLHSPKDIPGRFSVLSIVGLLPLQLAGVKIHKIIEGAKKAYFKQAYTLACNQYLQFKAKKNICALFAYSENLRCLADWYIQLLAESIGKSNKIGITPIKAIGVKDQHSQLQLFLDGPNDKFFIFLKPEKFNSDLKIPNENYTLRELFNAEYEGVKQAFTQKKKMFCEILLPQINEETLGELLMFFKLEIAFLGLLFKINFENQPAVELSKKITKNLLSN